MRLNINGQEYFKCDRCGNWNKSMELCNCLLTQRKSEIDRILQIGRARNEVFFTIVPKHFALNTNKEK